VSKPQNFHVRLDLQPREQRERLGRKQSDFWLRLASCTNVDHHTERGFFPSVFILEALFVQSKDGSSTLDGFYLSAGIAKASTAHDRYCHTNGARATLYIYFALSLAQMHSQYSRTSPEKWDATIFSSRVTATWEISFLGSYAKYSACVST
jgi:hypothetical protein